MTAIGFASLSSDIDALSDPKISLDPRIQCPNYLTTTLPYMTELSQNLEMWSVENPGEQGELASQLAAGLKDPAKASLWSLIDIPAEFERRSSSGSTYFLILKLQQVPFVRNNNAVIKVTKLLNLLFGLFDKVLPLFYIFPIAITWLSLSDVVRNYRTIGESIEESERVDFLTYWSGAGNSGIQYPGTPLSEVASYVFVFLVVIILLNLLTIPGQTESTSSRILRALSLEAQLTFAKSRAVTPDELTETLSIASNQLKTALEQSTVSMQSMAGMNEKLISVVNTLSNVSNSLSASAQKIEYSVQPLALLPTQLSEVFSSIGALPASLASVQHEIQTSADSLTDVTQTIRKMAQINSATNEHTAAFLENLAKAQLVASDFVSKMGDANRTVEDLAGQLQDREPHLVQLRTITEQFSKSVRSLHDIAEEFRYSADQYKAVNDAHRSDQ